MPAEEIEQLQQWSPNDVILHSCWTSRGLPGHVTHRFALMLLHLTSNYDFMWKRIVFGIMWLKIVVFSAGILSMWSTTFFQNFNFEFDWMTAITISSLKVIKNMFILRRVTNQFYGYTSPNYRNLLVRWIIFYQYICWRPN